ncbi:MAG TPA: MraY family glycosyltransferase [Anaerolineaceae bacterium]|nr:MraY family glycosyltransferase [Anaerolineaceae bacterium]
MTDIRIFQILFLTTATAFLAAPGLVWLVGKLNLFDSPGSEPHKRHIKRIPLAGGWILYFTLALISILTGLITEPVVRMFLAAGGIIFFFGSLDDARNLHPAVKLCGQIVAAGVLIAGGLQVHLFASEALNIAVTLLWIVGITNAFNLIDSMDGLVAGLSTLTAGCFMLVTLHSGQMQLSMVSIILLGAAGCCYYLNAAPARIFLGDSGAQLFGFLLATIGLAYNPVGYSPFSSWYVPVLLLGVPIFDTSLVVFSRLRRGKPIYRANLDHTYHRLVRLGMSSNRAILTIQFVAFFLDCLAFIGLNSTPVLANLIFGSLVILGAGAIAFLDRQSRWNEIDLAASPQSSQPG